MPYDVDKLPLEKLITPCTRAGEAIVRLDERISRSPLKEGFLERQDFSDAVSSLWIDGELVHIEDLVLHDAHMDIRAPTHEMTAAYRILRARRQIFSNVPDWALSPSGLSRLRGKGEEVLAPSSTTKAEEEAGTWTSDSESDILTDGFAELDALIARSSATIDAIATGQQPRPQAERDTLIHDPDWDEDERLAEWKSVVKAANDLPPVLRSAIMLDAWNRLEVLQRSPWLGRQLAAALLREEGVTPAHLPTINTGLRAIPRERRYDQSKTARILAILDSFHEAAVIGVKEHDRLLHAKSRMERRLVGRRSNSRLPELIALVLARPVVSTSMIVKALGTTPQGAVGLANQLELREMTGRGRFRAWGIL
jgi:hypothetical protein